MINTLQTGLDQTRRGVILEEIADEVEKTNQSNNNLRNNNYSRQYNFSLKDQYFHDEAIIELYNSSGVN